MNLNDIGTCFSLLLEGGNTFGKVIGSLLEIYDESEDDMIPGSFEWNFGKHQFTSMEIGKSISNRNFLTSSTH